MNQTKIIKCHLCKRREAVVKYRVRIKAEHLWYPNLEPDKEYDYDEERDLCGRCANKVVDYFEKGKIRRYT